jgi:hypothetical protein
MDRATIKKLWNDAWETGLGHAPWKSVLEGITPAQARWKPAPDRHSIWENVNHVSFWRETIAAAARGKPMPADDLIAKKNFEAPQSEADATPGAWNAAKQRFATSYGAMSEVYSDPSTSHDWMWGLVGHDCYHVGQIMLLRGLQNVPAIM